MNDQWTSWVEALQSNDEARRNEAWEAVYAAFQPSVRQLAHNLTGRHAWADEITQETFLQIHRHAGTFRASGTFRAWVLTIAANLSRRLLVREELLRRRVAERPAPAPAEPHDPA